MSPETITIRWVVIWAALAGIFLGAEWVFHERRQRRADRAWAARVAKDMRDADYLRWLEARWNDASLDEILGGEKEEW